MFIRQLSMPASRALLRGRTSPSTCIRVQASGVHGRCLSGPAVARVAASGRSPEQSYWPRAGMRQVAKRCPAGISRRCGFTLFELLLVLAILAVVAAAAYPSIRRLMSERIVRQAAETLAVKFNATRVRAIENGIAYQFRVQAGGRQYCAAPAEAVDINRVNAVAGSAQTGVGSTPGASTTASGSGGDGTNLATWRLLGELNTGVKIEAPVLQGTSPIALPIDINTFTGRNDTAAYAETIWSEPIVIQPDGSSTSASIEVVGDNGWVYRISVRGLTGGTRVQSLGTRSKP